MDPIPLCRRLLTRTNALTLHGSRKRAYGRLTRQHHQPVLNRVETMGACLASIAREAYRPIEHIVVDGGSTDGPLDLLREYRAPYPFHLGK
jgi:Glycosyl transferase family 2